MKKGTLKEENPNMSLQAETVISVNDDVLTDGDGPTKLPLEDLEAHKNYTNDQEELKFQPNTGGNAFSRWVEKVEKLIFGFVAKHWHRIRLGIYIIVLLLYLLYFGYCMNYRYGDEGSIILIVVTVLLLWKIFFKILDSRGIAVGLPDGFYSFMQSKPGGRFRKIMKYTAGIVVTAAIVVYLSLDIFPENSSNLQSFFGMLGMIFICFITSAKPSGVNWHPVFWAFVVQLALAFFTLRTQIGKDIFDWLGELVETLFSFADDGSEFVIGKNFKTWGLAISASGLIIFTNAFVSLMAHWGVIEFIIIKIGGFLAFCLNTGPVESVAAAANIFMALMESPLMIRPYLPHVTKSELHTIMTCGFASISGAALGIFILMGASSNHLLTASVISAPAALAISKLMYPETEIVKQQSNAGLRVGGKKEANSLSAFSDGAMMGVGICAAVWSNMLAFVSMISLLDALLGWLGDRAGSGELTFSVVCSYALFPVAYLMGVDTSDCRKVGELIGIKLFSTPFISYRQLGFLIKNREQFETYLTSSNDTGWHWAGDDILLEASNTTLTGGILSERTEVIATYAMCGFSALSAIGVSLGAFIPLCPSRKQDFASLTFRAFVAGNVASFATGAVAGVLFTSGD